MSKLLCSSVYSLLHWLTEDLFRAGHQVACQKGCYIEPHNRKFTDVRTGEERNVVKLHIKPSVMLELQIWSGLFTEGALWGCKCECMCVWVPGQCVVPGLMDGCRSGLSQYPECNLLKRMYWVRLQRQETPPWDADRWVERLPHYNYTQLHTCMPLPLAALWWGVSFPVLRWHLPTMNH